MLGGRALVAAEANKALDLIGGKTITIGSVSGGERFVAGGRLLIVGTDRVDGAALDASQRWTWTAPTGTTSVTLVAATATTVLARTCAEGACVLNGIGAGGATAWTMPVPASTSGDPVRAPEGGLPAYGILPAGERTWLLVDPRSSRTVLRVADRVEAAPEGTVVLQADTTSGQCEMVTGPDVDSLSTALQPCTQWQPTQAWLPRLDAEEVLAWWRPWSPHLHVTYLTPAGDGPRLVTAEPVTLLSTDPDGVAVRQGDRVVRYLTERRPTDPSP